MKETLQPGAVYRDPQDDNALFVCAGETDQLGETPIVNWNGTHGTAWGTPALYVKEADSIQEYMEAQRNRAAPQRKAIAAIRDTVGEIVNGFKPDPSDEGNLERIVEEEIDLMVKDPNWPHPKCCR